jgi:glycerophosphoryl diester phosphodiesterase
VVGIQPGFNQRISTTFDIQGHRGFRGLYPENCIEGFLAAVQVGVTTLELDVVISADSQVIVSHDPFLASLICKGPNGEIIEHRNQKLYSLFQMTADSIAKCDCGSLHHPSFPQQKKTPSFKPKLSEVIDAVEALVKEKGLSTIHYNIETKINNGKEAKFTPSPEIFTRLLLNVCKEKNIIDRTILQSFDPRTLKIAKKSIPSLKIALLTGSPISPQKQIKAQGFQPDIYSPYFKFISKRQINLLHEKGIQVIPWTVNQEKDMRKLIAIGADGIISDYPDRLVNLIKN